MALRDSTAAKAIKNLLEQRHVLKVQSVHEIEHNGTTYRVAKTNKGHLVLFPGAKVTLESFVEMINRENAKPGAAPTEYDRSDLADYLHEILRIPKKRQFEWRGSQVSSYGFANRHDKRAVIRTLGVFEVPSPNRKTPLKVFHRVIKPNTQGNNSTPLEEAMRLHKAQERTGFKHEVPLAVFLPRRLSRFPEMLFTTFIPAHHTDTTWDVLTDEFKYNQHGDKKPPAIIGTDVLRTGKTGKGIVFVDAEFSKPNDRYARKHYPLRGEMASAVNNAATLKRKVKRL